MGEEKNIFSEMESMSSTWQKTAKDYWEAMGRVMSEASPDTAGKQQDEFSRQINSMWQAYFKTLNTPDLGSAGLTRFPEIFSRITQELWSGILSKQAEEGGGDKTDDLRNTVKHLSKSWFDLYDKEFRQILNIPQLGLTRFYQEHAVKAVEELNDFQAAVAQFINLLSEPLIEAIQSVRKEVESTREGGEDLVKEAKAQYQTWIQKLEKAYLDLLRSPEFTSTLSETMKALRDYRISKQQLLIDLLQDLPVPTHKDMDELYREIYLLKKRVKELEKGGRKNG